MRTFVSDFFLINSLSLQLWYTCADIELQEWNVKKIFLRNKKPIFLFPSFRISIWHSNDFRYPEINITGMYGQKTISFPVTRYISLMCGGERDRKQYRKVSATKIKSQPCRKKKKKNQGRVMGFSLNFRLWGHSSFPPSAGQLLTPGSKSTWGQTLLCAERESP